MSKELFVMEIEEFINELENGALLEDFLLEVGEPQEHWNVSRSKILKYSVEVYHKGLMEHKILTAPTLDSLTTKTENQIRKWFVRWNKIVEKQEEEKERQQKQEIAQKKSAEAKQLFKALDEVLLEALQAENVIDWDSLKRNDKFKKSKPKKEPYKECPPKPQKDDDEFVPKFSFFEKIFWFMKEEKIKFFEKKYQEAVLEWEETRRTIENENREIDRQYEDELKEWKKEKEKFLKKQQRHNLEIDRFKRSYFDREPNAVIKYNRMVLDNSVYPSFFPKSFELEYNPETRVLIIEYQFPAIEDFPTLKEVRYVASKNELKEMHISQTQLNKIYDDVIYKVALRTLYELFEADKAEALELISFNGWVETIDRATGKEVTNCILSIQVKKEQFLEINLSKVDPKICFKSLKGIASSKLSTLTPIKPILQITKTDKRFVDSYEVIKDVDDSTNLAAMDWEDFEHLIRELFEKEFKHSGGEVKVTQASHDGGVDAIAFDPDPIRGGKIIIQAKRYTNTVGVAAVRDLYGTVVNEGAIKGILVTTADYGADAYEFAKDKPLTLLNGANLLQMLEKYGYHAKIDLKEAKRILKEREKK